MQASFLIINFHRPGNLELAGGEAARIALESFYLANKTASLKEKDFHGFLLSFTGQYYNQSTDTSHTNCLLPYSEGIALSTKSPSAERPSKMKPPIPLCLINRGHVLERGPSPFLGSQPGRGCGPPLCQGN